MLKSVSNPLSHKNNIDDDLNESKSMLANLKLNMECQRQIGNEKYIFFYPISIGQFEISCWSCQKTNLPKSHKDNGSTDSSEGRLYGITIYEKGEIMDPSQDFRFKSLKPLWANRERGWTNQLFTKSEIMKIFEHLHKMPCE